MQRIRVLVVDDHRIFAESLAAALASEQDVEAASSCGGAAALRCLERGAPDGHRFDVLLVDAELGVAAAEGGPPGRAVPAQGPHAQGPHAQSSAGHPHAVPPSSAQPPALRPHAAQPQEGPVNGHAPRPGGLALVARVRAESPRIRVVVLAERDDPRHAAVALQAGAGGWVAKDCSLSRLLHVIRGVLKGETHLPPALLTGVLRELTATRRNRTESEKLVESLTPREHEVLRCMVAGLGRKAVAERLYLSPHTVRTHMQNVLGKLGVHSTLAAVALARRAGVGPVDLGAGANTGSAAG